MAARRERRHRTARERSDCEAAVGLVRDDHDRFSPTLSDLAEYIRRGAWREPLVDRGLAEADARGECGSGLTRAAERARHDGVRLDSLVTQLGAQGPRLLPAGRRE